MTHIVTEPCHGCKDTSCVTTCPVDAFLEDEKSLWIDPAICIDCALCIPACPVQAIYLDTKVPPKWQHYIRLNAEKVGKLPIIYDRKPPLS